MAHTPEPTRLRVALGKRMRTLREQSSVTAKQAAAVIDGSVPKISRIETGKSALKRIEIEALLRTYGADDEMITDTLILMEEAKKPDWWEDEASVVPIGLGQLFNSESSAKTLRTVSSTIVFGMLQTESYARAIFDAHCPDDSEDVKARRVKLRLRRQDLLNRDDPPQLTALIDEAALRREVGSRAVMREQVEHLIEMDKRPTITIKVIPFSAGAHRGQIGSFLWLEFPEDDATDVIYSDNPSGNSYFSRPDEVAAFVSTFTSIDKLSLAPADTRRFLHKLTMEYTK
ncbi:helix-turn-helix domain-containing protein [Embleya sp. NPDC127516]|uniref:helix-turn-helix domain-containing protein n=1 Tax=Embleya sp. NPDC127516 TaxID=3363990 RepID=UPI0037F47D48